MEIAKQGVKWYWFLEWHPLLVFLLPGLIVHELFLRDSRLATILLISFALTCPLVSAIVPDLVKKRLRADWVGPTLPFKLLVGGAIAIEMIIFLFVIVLSTE